MNIYIHREGMVELAFNSLIHLIYHSELNKSRVGGSGSVRTELVDTGKNIFMTVCKAMIDYKDNENIIENVFRFFLLSLNGSSSDVNKLLLLSDNLNLFSLISEVLSINAIQTEVIRLGCGLLLVLKYEDNDYREKLRIAGQLDYKGKASPKGTFEEIAVAWGFEDKRVPGAGIGPQISSLEMSM